MITIFFKYISVTWATEIYWAFAKISTAKQPFNIFPIFNLRIVRFGRLPKIDANSLRHRKITSCELVIFLCLFCIVKSPRHKLVREGFSF